MIKNLTQQEARALAEALEGMKRSVLATYQVPEGPFQIGEHPRVEISLRFVEEGRGTGHELQRTEPVPTKKPVNKVIEKPTCGSCRYLKRGLGSKSYCGQEACYRSGQIVGDKTPACSYYERQG
jgi:hypothetical protein